MPTFQVTFREPQTRAGASFVDRMQADHIEYPEGETFQADSSALIQMISTGVPGWIIAHQDDRRVLLNTAGIALIEVVA